MKKSIVIGVFLIFSLFTVSLVLAESCNLGASLINQDPYPAIPGEEAKVVFQLTGVGNPLCKDVEFEFIEKFPFKLSPDQNAITTSQGGQVSDFSSYLLIPYRLRIDKDALDGENAAEVRYSTILGISTVKEFNITVEDLTTSFEISIKDYVSGSQTLTFEILNVGENDVEALTVEIPKQDNIQVKGNSREIVGSLDSNEDTTFNFEAIPKDGQIELNVLYTDEINERRQVQESVVYDSSYFTGRARDQKETGTTTYVIVGVVIIIIVWYFWRKKKKRDKHKQGHG